MTCTPESHAALKADPVRWANETLLPPGHATRPVMDDGETFLELANCPRCFSTLAVKVEVELKP